MGSVGLGAWLASRASETGKGPGGEPGLNYPTVSWG
jgi:hypothetical protein